MKELLTEEKAKRYDEALEKARQLCVYPTSKPFIGDLQDIFPELKEPEDEKIKKAVIDAVETLSDSPLKVKMLAWLEKQGKKDQLYIRFGEIPTDEKSKIYQGEIEVGTENGVSVYPAFKTDEGNIVLGLSLPITKTTLHTQQHLIEYDDRPCYLVKGDYVGKDTDGQPLINNVSIIKKIDNYRVKEKKQGEQKPQGKTALEAINEEKVDNQNCMKPIDKVEPKYKIGDWVIIAAFETEYYHPVGEVIDIKFYCDKTGKVTTSYIIKCLDGKLIDDGIDPNISENQLRLWSIKDAKDGDVVVDKSDGAIGIFQSIGHHPDGGSYNDPSYCFLHCRYDDGFFYADFEHGNTIDSDDLIPATKEQREQLKKAMADAGYTFDFEKKELNKIEYETKIPFGAKDSE